MTDFYTEILLEEEAPELAPNDKSEDQLRQALPSKTPKGKLSKIDDLQSVAGNTALLQQAEAKRRQKSVNDTQENALQDKLTSQSEEQTLNPEPKDPQALNNSNPESVNGVEKLDPDTEHERILILARVAANLSENPDRAPLGAMFAIYRSAPKIQVERAAKTFMSVFLRIPSEARLATRKAINAEMKNYAETLLARILRMRLGQIVAPPPSVPPPSPGGDP